MSVRRILLAGLIALAALLVVAAPAFATAPGVSPETVSGPIKFDTSAAPFVTSGTYIGGDPDPAAWWDRVTTRYYSAGGALWCAGSLTSAPTAGQKYPEWTRGSAVLSLPELANYYSSTWEFRYNWANYAPYNVSVQDWFAFVAEWQAIGANPIVNQQDRSMPKQANTTTWQLWTEDLSKSSNTVALSRRGGKLIFEFSDDAGAFGENPATNLGPTVDDVTVKGYTYGAVRDLHANLAAAGGTNMSVTLSWSRPASSTTDARDDTRAKRYRIWREDNVASSPTLLGSVDDPGTGALTYTDGPIASDVDHRYYVQAINPGADPASPAHWGELAAPLLVTKQIVPTTGVSISPASPSSTGWYLTPPTVTLYADVSDSITWYRVDSGSWQWSADPVPAILLTNGTHTVYYYSVNQLGLEETQKQAGPFKIDTIAPGKPTPSISSVTQTSMTISWPSVTDPGPGASGVSAYRVYDGSANLVATVPVGSGTISYTPTDLVAGTNYSFKVIAVDVAGNLSSSVGSAQAVAARTKDPFQTLLSASVPANRVVSYNRPTVVNADLGYVSNGIPTYLQGQSSNLKVYSSTTGPTGPWSPTSFTFTDMSFGQYISTVRTTWNTWYQVRFPASGPYAANETTNTMYIQARCSFGSLRVPTVAYRSRTARVYTTMLPKHNTYKSTRIYFERYEAYRGKYQWRTKFYKYATLTTTSSWSYELCAVNLRFPYVGKWRIRVRHADTSHYPTYSAYSRTITVR